MQGASIPKSRPTVDLLFDPSQHPFRSEQHLFIGRSNDSDPLRLEHRLTLGIVFLPLLVRRIVDLNAEPNFCGIEVNDATLDGLLAAKLYAGQLAALKVSPKFGLDDSLTFAKYLRKGFGTDTTS